MRSSTIRSTFLAACAALSLACGGGGSGGTTTPPNPPPPPPAPKPPLSGAIDPSAVALMIGADPAGSARKTALQVDPTGAVSTIVFLDEDSRPVDVDITKAEALGEGFFALELSWKDSSSMRPIKALWRASDGRLFDMSAFNVTGGQLKGNDLYVISAASDAAHSYSHTLYHVDAASLGTTLVATPMNNPAADVLPYPGPLMLVDQDGDVMAQTGGWDYTIFFHANTAPRAVTNQGLTFCPTGANGGQLALVYGEDGAIYALCAEQVPDLSNNLQNFLRYFVRKVAFDAVGPVTFDSEFIRTATCTGLTSNNIVCTETRLNPSTPYKLQHRSRYIPLTTGFFAMSPIAGGGVSLTWTDKVFPAMASPLVSGASMYWKDGDTIRRIGFAAGSSTEDMVSASSIIGFKVANGLVLFTRYDTGTSIGTYVVTGPGVPPVKLASSDMQVQYISEL